MGDGEQKGDIYKNLYPQLVAKFDQMTDKALKRIWRDNDQHVYSLLAFTAVEEVLYTRGIQPPAQLHPVKRHARIKGEKIRARTFYLTFILTFWLTWLGYTNYQAGHAYTANVFFMFAIFPLSIWNQMYFSGVITITSALGLSFFYFLPPIATGLNF